MDTAATGMRDAKRRDRAVATQRPPVLRDPRCAAVGLRQSGDQQAV